MSATREAQGSVLAPHLRSAARDVRWTLLLAAAATLAATLLTGSALLAAIVLVPQGRLAEALTAASVLVLIGALVGIVADRAGLSAQRRLLARLEESVWSALLRQPLHFFTSRSIRELLGYAGSMGMVRRLLGPHSLEALLASLSVAAITVMLAVIDPSLAARALIVITGIGAVALQLFHRQQKQDLAVMQEVESAQATLYPALMGRDEVEVFQAHSHVQAQWQASFTRQKDADRAGLRVADPATAVLQATPAIFLAVLCPAVLDSGGGAVGIGTLAILAVQLGSAVARLIPVVPALFSLALADRRLRPVLGGERQTRTTESAAVPQPQMASGAAGRLDLQELHFRFPGASTPLLCGASASVAPGEMVAVIGPSGSGKSTLLHLVLGLASPEGGAVLLDGVDVCRLPEQDLRRRLAVVAQGGGLLRGTLREAVIGFREGIDDAAIRLALRRAGLDDLVASLPMGLETRISDGRSGFSGGEEQRILLARALVGAPSVLLLDEATSALDPTTEADVVAAVAELQVTRIVVAHRLSTILCADQVLLLRDGRLHCVATRDPHRLASLVASASRRDLEPCPLLTPQGVRP